MSIFHEFQFEKIKLFFFQIKAKLNRKGLVKIVIENTLFSFERESWYFRDLGCICFRAFGGGSALLGRHLASSAFFTDF